MPAPMSAGVPTIAVDPDGGAAVEGTRSVGSRGPPNGDAAGCSQRPKEKQKIFSQVVV